MGHWLINPPPVYFSMSIVQSITFEMRDRKKTLSSAIIKGLAQFFAGFGYLNPLLIQWA